MDSSNLTASIYFAAAMRVAADVSLTRLLPLHALKQPLAPHECFSQRILLALQALGVIEPELSLSHAEDWLTAKDWMQLGLDSLAWRIRWAPRDCRANQDAAKEILEGIEPSDDTLNTLLSLWEDLALAEVAQYADWALARSGYNPQWVLQAIEPLRQALKTFSVSQVMYLVHIAIRSVATTHQQGGTASSRLGETLANSISAFARRAIHESWHIRPMARPHELPMSTIAMIFAHEVTRLDEEYLERTPSIRALVDAMTRIRSLH